MGDRRRFQVTVSFRCGARATIMMAHEPVIPAALWSDGSLSWLGDPGGPMLELNGNDVTALSVRRIDDEILMSLTTPQRDRFARTLGEAKPSLGDS